MRSNSKNTIMAVEEQLFTERMARFNESYERLKSNKEQWAEELAEREELEGTLEDGLFDDSAVFFL